VSSPKIRLLLDESVTDPLAKKILEILPSATYVRHSATMKGKLDPEIAEYANRERRAILALDSDYKDLYVREGVIKITVGRSDEECLFAIFRTFWQSGHRQKSRKRRAYLTNDGLRITNGEAFVYAWHPKPCPHHGGN